MALFDLVERDRFLLGGVTLGGRRGEHLQLYRVGVPLAGTNDRGVQLQNPSATKTIGRRPRHGASIGQKSSNVSAMGGTVKVYSSRLTIALRMDYISD